MEKVNLFEAIQYNSIRALRDHILVCDMNFDMKITTGGIILLADNGKLEGIHPRWGKVYAVGPDQQDIKVGQYVCVKHGRWTRGLKVEDAEGEKIIRRIDHNDILLVSDDPMQDETLGQGL
jgi:hypothetical protein